MVNKIKKISDSQLQAYVDGQLTQPVAEGIEENLRSNRTAADKVEDARLLRRALRDSAPRVPSKKMWKNIRADLHRKDPQAFPAAGLFESWTWLRLPAVRWGFGAVCVGLVFMGLSQGGGQGFGPTRVAVGEKSETNSRAALPQEKEKLAVHLAQRKVPDRVVAETVKKVKAVKKSSIELALKSPRTERASTSLHKVAIRPPSAVEKALVLQGSDLNRMIRDLSARERSLALRPHRDRVRGNFGAREVSADGGEVLVAVPRPLRPPTVPRIDRDGFWNWAPAAVAMNRRDWGLAGGEFDLARREAAESSERSFGASARLSMNQVQGIEDDLGLGDLRRYPGLGLVVLQSGAWQLLVPHRQARFQGTVKTRLAGFRSEGPGFVYDLNFDRGEFSPGTSFIRLAAEISVTVLDSKGKIVSDNTFSAPHGAEFNFSTGELHLK